MDLLNQTLNSFSIQTSDALVSLNLDIFEANLINLILLDGGLFYLLSAALSENLSKRQQKILETIQESEEKLQEATLKLLVSKTKLSDVNVVIDSIQEDAQQAADQLMLTIVLDGFFETKRITSNAVAQSKTIESQVLKQISNYFVQVILKRARSNLAEQLTPSVHEFLIDRHIARLGGFNFKVDYDDVQYLAFDYSSNLEKTYQ